MYNWFRFLTLFVRRSRFQLSGVEFRLDPDTKRSSVIVAPSNATVSARTRTSSSDARGTSRECQYPLDPRLRILRTTSRGSTIASSDLFQPGRRFLLSRDVTVFLILGR